MDDPKIDAYISGAELARIAEALERIATILDDATAAEQARGRGWRAGDPFAGLVPRRNAGGR